MNEDLFVRVSVGKRNGEAKVVHVAKGRFPNEALCGRVLEPAPVKSRGRVKCAACQTSLKRLRTEESSGQVSQS